MRQSSDILIVGGGIIGCAIAYELARRGARVQVLESRGVSLGATQASAGVLAPYIESDQGSPLLDLGVQSLNLYDDFITRVVADAGRSVQYARTGTLEVAVTPEAAGRFKAAVERHAVAGVHSHYLDRAAARSAEPHLADAVTAALLIDDHAYVAAAELTRALADAAERFGAVISSAHVTRIAREDGGVRVDLEGGHLSAGTLVLAAGSWAGTIASDAAPPLPVRPVRGQLLELEWTGRPLARVTWGARCYLVPWQSGSLLVGATVEEAGFDERTTAAGVRDLLDAVCDLVPHAWQAGFRAARVGLRPGTPDGLPVVGRSARVPGLFYATGHYRSGVLLAPLTAALVARAILDGEDDPRLAIMAPQRFGEY